MLRKNKGYSALGLWLWVGTSWAATSQTVETLAPHAAGLRDELVALRRQLHELPEASGGEERTASLVAQRLRGLGLEVRTGIGGHGVVAVLRGGKEGPVVAYRAELDAVTLPGAQEEQVKHLCGHDAHVAVAVGIATVLEREKAELPGTVLFLFQPSQENLFGAEDMLRDGALRHPKPEAIFAVHAAPLPVGKVGCIQGQALPGQQDYDIALRGVEDLEAVARRLMDEIAGLSTVSRPQSPDEIEGFARALQDESQGGLAGFVWSQARREARDGDGAVPEEEVRLKGQVRAAQGDGVRPVLFRIRQMLTELQAEGTSFEMRMDEPFPPLINPPQLTARACRVMASALGPENVVPIHASHPFHLDDFAYFQQVVPGSLFWLGVANSERGIAGMPHSPTFDMDEAALVVATKAMVSVLVDYLQSNRAGRPSAPQ